MSASNKPMASTSGMPPLEPVRKPSYSTVDDPVPELGLDQGDIRGYRMMHPEQILSRKCLSTESAVTHQHHITQIPLGAKLPMVPGNSTTLVTTKLGQRLQKPSCDFDISTPKEIYVSNEYNDLHDPHLINYFKKNKALKNHLEEMGYIDSQGSIICKLNTYNLYRQYLKKLSIDGLNKKYRRFRMKKSGIFCLSGEIFFSSFFEYFFGHFSHVWLFYHERAKLYHEKRPF